MTFRNAARILVFSAALAGCASTQEAAVAPLPRTQPRPAAAPARVETPTERCQRERRSRVQECIVEGIVTSCRERNESNEDGFYSCVSEGLAAPASSERSVTVTVSQGDEVLSLRAGAFTVMDLVRLDATTIDQQGVEFTFSIDRIAVAEPANRTPVEQAAIRINYDGTSSGDLFKLRTLDLWNLRVEAAGSGSARVLFQTADPRILVRPSE